MLLFISCSNQPSKGIMKKTICFKTRVIALLLAFAAALLLAPSSALAQAYWLQYQLNVNASRGPDNPNYDSGRVQGTNLVTTTISIYPNQWNDAYVTTSASYGWLQFNAGCGVNDDPSDGDGYSAKFGPGVGGGADVFFQDTLTVTSATLPGEPQCRFKLLVSIPAQLRPALLVDRMRMMGLIQAPQLA